MSESQDSQLPAEVRQLTILVAEPNPALQKSVVARLGEAGAAHCEMVSSGQEAWKFWKQSGRVGVIIASANLSGLSGIELLKHVRADKEAGLQPAFIVMSDDDSPGAVDTAVREGADCFVLKPFPLGSLQSLVFEGVEHRKQMAGKDCFLRALEKKSDDGLIRAVLTYERRQEEIECDMLSGTKCVLIADHNFGLGTMLEIRFVRPASLGEGAYLPIKGQVTKMERRGRAGDYLVHLQFSTPPTDEHGIRDLLLTDSTS